MIKVVSSLPSEGMVISKMVGSSRVVKWSLANRLKMPLFVRS